MCGSLRHENTAKNLKPNDPVAVKSGSDHWINGFWNGHAREETLENWTSKGWKEGTMPGITGYTEGYKEKQKEFDVPKGKVIKVIYNPSISMMGRNPVQIVTRDAQGDEKLTHPRFPRVIDE
jgi:hypothetical protein